MKFLFSIASAIFFTYATVNAHWVVKEEWISPEIEQFDCHSSSIVETEEGQYCVVWKGGHGQGRSNGEMDANVGVWISSYNTQWSAPEEVIKSPHSICWNPVLCKTPANELLLFYRMGSTPRTALGFIKRSLDQGKNWSESEILPAGIVGPTKNKPLFTSTGVLISPSSVEVGNPEDALKATACWIEISEDNGVHWKKIGPLESPDSKFAVIEPALFYNSNGDLSMMSRDRANRIGNIGFIWMASSKDEGLTWSDLIPTNLPNPDSGIEVVDLGQGKLVLIYNHSHTDRFPLHLGVSLDGGITWSNPMILDDSGEFPAAILGSDGLIHITYARCDRNDSIQRRIKHVVVSPEALFEAARFTSE